MYGRPSWTTSLPPVRCSPGPTTGKAKRAICGCSTCCSTTTSTSISKRVSRACRATASVSSSRASRKTSRRRYGTCWAVTPTRWSLGRTDCARSPRIRRPVLAGIDILPGIDAHVDVGVNANVLAAAAAGFQAQRHPVRTVDQVMAVAVVLRKRRAITGAQDGFPAVVDQHHFAGQHPDEFVLGRMPVSLAGPRARRELQQVHPEVGQAAGIAQASPHARGAGSVERLWVGRPGATLYGSGVNSWHAPSP